MTSSTIQTVNQPTRTATATASTAVRAHRADGLRKSTRKKAKPISAAVVITTGPLMSIFRMVFMFVLPASTSCYWLPCHHLAEKTRALGGGKSREVSRADGDADGRQSQRVRVVHIQSAVVGLEPGL